MREKHMWEVQLRNLGGPNYMRFASKMTDEGGREVAGHKGYKYFGRARELPGVKELFDELKSSPKDETKKALSDIRKNVDANYYGFNRDEEDGSLLAYEAQKEVESWKIISQSTEGELKPGWESLPDNWQIPTGKEVMQFLVERRKKQLLDGLS